MKQRQERLEERMEVRIYGGDETEARKAGRQDGGKNSIIQYFPPNFVALSV